MWFDMGTLLVLLTLGESPLMPGIPDLSRMPSPRYTTRPPAYAPNVKTCSEGEGIGAAFNLPPSFNLTANDLWDLPACKEVLSYIRDLPCVPPPYEQWQLNADGTSRTRLPHWPEIVWCTWRSSDGPDGEERGGPRTVGVIHPHIRDLSADARNYFPGFVGS
jgi:hypothetical protein